MRPKDTLKYSGIFAIILAWIIIFACWTLNPWFVFTEDAFSDFGGHRACCPQLYNFGLIAVGILMIVYGYFLYSISKEKLETLGSGYIALSGVFLALIGVFPSGTRPHTFVSSWFFLQADMALIILGAGMMLRGLRYGKAIFIISTIAIPLAILLELIWGWPSAAVLETYGIIIIDLCIVLMSITYRGSLIH